MIPWAGALLLMMACTGLRTSPPDGVGGQAGGAAGATGGGGAGAAGAGGAAGEAAGATGGGAGDGGTSGAGGGAAGGGAAGGAGAGGAAGDGGTSGAGGGAAGGAGAGGAAGAPEWHEGPTTGLVLWWRLNDGVGNTVTDSSPGGLTGTFLGTPTWTAGMEGAALHFNGFTQAVGAMPPESSPLNAIGGAVTMAAWIFIDDPNPTAFDTVIGRRHTGEGNTQSMWLGVQNGRPYCTIHDLDNGALGLNILQTGRWIHLACTYDRTNVIVYADGAEARRYRQTLDISDTRDPIMIGAGTFGDGTEINDYFRGVIDDVRVYDRTLSAAEIAAFVGR